MIWCYDLGGRLYLRPMTDSPEDAYTVARWYNLNPARRRQYRQGIFTPDHHVAAMRDRKPHDFLWMIHQKEPDRAIGMVGLTIYPADYAAEYGRLFIDPASRGEGYGLETEYMVLSLAFEFFGLERLWGDVLVSNEGAMELHKATGWQYVGMDAHGHPSDRGPVWHIEFMAERWPEYRARFIERFGVTL